MVNGAATSDLGGRILEKCKELDALKFGEFTLASGQISKYYFDGRLLTLSPEGANLVAQALLPTIRESGAVAVGGPAVAAVPMVTAVAMLSGQDGGGEIAGFFVRPQVKDHGMGKSIEGPLPSGVPVVIVDDACSTAGSLYLAIEAAEAAGHKVVMVACILNRNQGGSARLRADGYNFVALLEGDDQGNVSVV
ncbi:MAG: orotate phosphoribosyltransferase [Chloroflexi bacterium]|nr:orotate phosphoribosyltransferase [Chloroflexota bacterium]